MIVVADTSPINYLVLIGRIGLLEQLYTRVLIPSAVLTELKHPLAPQAVRGWVMNVPPWLEISNPRTSVKCAQLDIGESEAIALATEVAAELVLIDDQAGREEAVRRGLKVAGTISVLDEADRCGLIILEDAINELRKTSFRISPAVLSAIRLKRSR